MIGRGIARRYAQSFFAIGEEKGQIDRFREELTAFMGILADQAATRRALVHPLVEAEEKRRLIEALLGERASVSTRSFLKLIVDKHREDLLDDIYREFLNLCDEKENIAEVRAVSAYPLSDELEADLRDRLEQATGRRVRLRTEVDPRLMGGLVVTIGDRRIDGSLRARLRGLRATLKGDDSALRGATS